MNRKMRITLLMTPFPASLPFYRECSILAGSCRPKLLKRNKRACFLSMARIAAKGACCLSGPRGSALIRCLITPASQALCSLHLPFPSRHRSRG